MQKRPRILIIGAGIAGPATALFLARCGADVALAEMHPHRAVVGGALTIAPNGMSIVAELGLAERLKEIGTIINAYSFNTISGWKIGQTIAPTTDQPSVSLSRQTLYDLLLDEAESQDIELHFNKRLVSIREAQGGIEASFEDGSTTHADMIIGADGIWSRTRELISPSGPQPKFTGLIGGGGFMPQSVVFQNLGPHSANRMNFYWG